MIASGKAVHITPIVTRSDDTEVPEIGIGGGGGDLYQSHELELPDETSVEQLKKLCLEHMPDSDTFTRTKEALLEAFRSKKKTLSLDKYGLKDENDISLQKLVDVLSHGQSFDTNDTQKEQRLKPDGYRGSEHELPKQIVSNCDPLIHIKSLTKKDIPIFTPFFVCRALRAGCRFQTQRHFSMYRRPRQLERGRLYGEIIWPPMLCRYLLA